MLRVALPNGFPMVAVTEKVEDTGLAFKNLCGILKVQMTGTDTIRTIKLEGKNDEILSGPAVITAQFNLPPETEMQPEGTDYIIMDCGEGVILNETELTSFWLAVPPTTFTHGFTITITRWDRILCFANYTQL